MSNIYFSFQEIKHLKTESLYIWKLFQSISNVNMKRPDILWSNLEEELLIKQWIEYSNTQILHSNAAQVSTQVLNVRKTVSA